MGLLLRGGRVVTMNKKRECFHGDVRVEGSRIESLGVSLKPRAGDEVLDVSGHFVVPGFIQAHTHLCQVLFRGLADDMQLLDWLRKRIWPMEHAHTPESLKASAELGLLEMQLLGTTSILDMGTVRHTDSLFEAAEESGMRYFGGNCLMDRKSTSGPLWQSREEALKECERLIKKWHKKTDLLDYVLNPRFAVSCSDRLLRDCGEMQKGLGLRIHTHASENLGEIELVKKQTGMNNVDYFDSIGLLNTSTVIAHGVHLTKGELGKMVRTETPLVHCPSSNLKLASGIAPVFVYHQKGLKIALGADGAPCNNTMDPFMEMRLAALLQKPKFGPEAIPAEVAFEIATLGGARALGREKDLGSLEPGKLADLAVVEATHPSVATVENPYSALVYSCSGRDVRHVLIHGQMVVRDRKHRQWSHHDVITRAARELKSLLQRAKLT